MSASAVPVLEARESQNLALEAVEVDGQLNGALAEVVLTQTYRNLEASSIEAVYTFPLPLDAVLLELVMEIGERRLTGVVQKKAQAEIRYEEAIEEGDTAVLLERAGPGLYTVNVGNLQPNERAVIKFRYSQLLHWQGDNLRFQLPTTLAPRYGDPSAAGLEPYQEPEYTLQADRGFRLSIKIDGALAKADFDCPTHSIAVSDTESRRTLTLSGGREQMDRDFVLVLREPEGGHSEALVAPVEDGVVVMATFHPQIEEAMETAARAIKLVVDCSGSMAGDSIAQAKLALRQIVDRLLPSDHFDIVAFGSASRSLFSKTVPVDEQSVQAARQFIDDLNADMGGTAMEDALQVAYQSAHPDNVSANVLLITDGEIWGGGSLISAARASEHRVFTIGVGSAVSEDIVHNLADATGGACELVSPREDMAERIVRHFRRINQPAASDVAIDWGHESMRQTPKRLRSLYTGDTLHVFGWLPAAPVAPIRLQATMFNGDEFVQSIDLQMLESEDSLTASLPRIAGWRLLSQVDVDEACEIALEHQLVTEQTSCVLIDVRDDNEKSKRLPNLRKVPHAIPAGWGGVGIIASMDMSFSTVASRMTLSESRMHSVADRSFGLPQTPTFSELASEIGRKLASRMSRRSFSYRISSLKKMGVPRSVLSDLGTLVAEGFAEKDVVLAFIRQLFEAHRTVVDDKAFDYVEHASNSLQEGLEDKLRSLDLGCSGA